MDVTPGACWLHTCKAQEHVFGLRGCRVPWSCQLSHVCLFFACRSVEGWISYSSIHNLWATWGIWFLENSSLSLWHVHWDLYVDSGGGFQLFSGDPVHAQCLSGGDSHLPFTRPSQSFARSLHAKRREATAVSFWVNWRQGLFQQGHFKIRW